MFISLCTFDAYYAKLNWLAVLIGISLAVIFMFFGMITVGVATMVIGMYRLDAYGKISNIIIITCMIIFASIVTLFVDPTLIRFFIRNLVITAIAMIFAGQMESLDRFLNSYHCRGISRNMMTAVFKRGYMITIACFFSIIVVAFIVRPQSPILHNLPNAVGDFIRTPTFTQESITAPEQFDPVDEEVENVYIEHIPTYFVEQGNFINVTMQVIIAIALVAICIAVVIIEKRFRRGKRKYDDFDDEYEEVSYNPEKSTRKHSLLSILGVNYAVRRLFKRKVKKYIAEKELHPRKSDTPMILADAIEEWEDIHALEELYHKARYSNENVKRSELNELNVKLRKVNR